LQPTKISLDLEAENILIALTILFQTLSIIFGKYASLNMGDFNLINILKNHFYYLSIFCLFLQAVSWQFVLKKYNLSYSYVFMSLVYVFTLIFSYFLFKESIKISNIIGTIFIIIGILICILEEKKNVN